jgi:hypothetical protein
MQGIEHTSGNTTVESRVWRDNAINLSFIAKKDIESLRRLAREELTSLGLLREIRNPDDLQTRDELLDLFSLLRSGYYGIGN